MLQDYAADRSQVLAGYGLQVVRFTNQQVLGNFESVCEAIAAVSPH